MGKFDDFSACRFYRVQVLNRGPQCNLNPMGAVWLLAMVAMTIAAVVTAKGAKWKLINLGIIVGLISLGLFTGFAAGMWARNNALGADIAVPSQSSSALWVVLDATGEIVGGKSGLPTRLD